MGRTHRLSSEPAENLVIKATTGGTRSVPICAPADCHRISSWLDPGATPYNRELLHKSQCGWPPPQQWWGSSTERMPAAPRLHTDLGVDLKRRQRRARRPSDVTLGLTVGDNGGQRHRPIERGGWIPGCQRQRRARLGTG